MAPFFWRILLLTVSLAAHSSAHLTTEDETRRHLIGAPAVSILVMGGLVAASLLVSLVCGVAFIVLTVYEWWIGPPDQDIQHDGQCKANPDDESSCASSSSSFATDDISQLAADDAV